MACRATKSTRARLLVVVWVVVGDAKAQARLWRHRLGDEAVVKEQLAARRLGVAEGERIPSRQVRLRSQLDRASLASTPKQASLRDDAGARRECAVCAASRAAAPPNSSGLCLRAARLEAGARRVGMVA